jgi:hypothetical protein
MTQLSAPTLYQCPACAGYFTRSVLTFLHYYNDVPKWSDRMNAQWWAGNGAPVGRCPACTKVIWVNDAKAVMPAPRKPHPIGVVARLWHRVSGDRKGRLRAERDWIALPREIKEADRIIGLQSAGDLLDALAVLAPDGGDREIYVRRRLWWASSDHHRLRIDGTPISTQPVVAPAEARTNALRLLELFENDPEQQVERGELLRQLGRFEEAVAVLKAVKPNGYSEVKAVKIQRFAETRNAELQSL